jgi:hypothetical protein
MKFPFPTSCFAAAALCAVFATGAAAQEPKSAAPAKELAQLLAAKKIDSIAARMPDSREEFVGALALPGQLMVVWAKTTAPAVVNEKLINKAYRDVYIDLNSASIIDTRHVVSDLGTDGLKAKPDQKSGPSDSADTGVKSIRFDGRWREVKMSEQDYMKAYSEADAAYAKAIQALLEELKKG